MAAFSIIVTLLFIILGLIRPQSKFVIWGLLILLWILFAFERTNEGDGDYSRYVAHYDNFGKGIIVVYEPLFLVIAYIGNTLKVSFDAIRAFVVILELFLLYKSISRYTKNIGAVLSLFFIFPALFDAELFRWFLGMCIVIAGFPVLINASKKRDYFIFALYVLLASMSHASCLFFLMYLLLAVKNRKTLIIIVLSLLTIGVLTSQSGLLQKMLSYLPISTEVIEDRYDDREIGSIKNVFRSAVLMILVYTSYYFSKIWLKPFKTNAVKYKEDVLRVERCNTLLIKIWSFNIISLLFVAISIYAAQTIRLVQVLVFYNYIFYAVALEQRKWNNLMKMTITVFISVTLVVWMLLDSEGTRPVLLSHFSIGYLIGFFNTIF